MLKLTALVIMLVPTIALADKNFEAGTGGSFDCAEDPIVNIDHADGSYTFTGDCKQINLNGSKLHVTVDSVDQLAVNGADNLVRLAKVDAILVNGDGNNVRWRHGKSVRRPTIAAHGARNSVVRTK